MLWTEEVQPKVAIVLRILSEVTGIAPGDPALFRCLLSVVAPCLVLILAGRGMPGPVQSLREMSKETLSTHVSTFALAGLEAIRRQRAAAGR